MLDKIKSKYNIKNIFLLLHYKAKLRLLKYNKNYQNCVNISIKSYKQLCDKYISYKDNGIGTEYNIKNNKIIYEGEFFKGKRNGKGKEYNSLGNIIFEGEYLKGKRWNGKGFFKNEVAYELKEGKSKAI